MEFLIFGFLLVPDLFPSDANYVLITSDTNWVLILISLFPDQVSQTMPGVMFGADGRYFFCIFCAISSLLSC